MNKPHAVAKPHVHAEAIKAWADGAEIEFFSNSKQKWVNCPDPMWDKNSKYRLKPEEPKVTHKIGNRYTREGSEYILAQCKPLEVVLISLKGADVGNRWVEPVRVEHLRKISEKEFDSICGNEGDFSLITD